MIIKNKQSLKEYFVLGHSKSMYFFTNLEEGNQWGGFFWQKKKDFNVLENDNSYLVEDSELYQVGRFKKEVRYIIPEFTISELRKIVIYPDDAHLFWNVDFLERKLTAISYVEKSLRNYPIKITQLSDYINNSFEERCVFYLQGFIEGILSKSDYGGASDILIYWENCDDDFYDKTRVDWESKLTEKLIKHPSFNDEFICRNIIRHLHAIFNYQNISHKLTLNNEFSSIYYFKLTLNSKNKRVVFEIDIPLP